MNTTKQTMLIEDALIRDIQEIQILKAKRLTERNQASLSLILSQYARETSGKDTRRIATQKQLVESLAINN